MRSRFRQGRGSGAVLRSRRVRDHPPKYRPNPSITSRKRTGIDRAARRADPAEARLRPIVPSVRLPAARFAIGRGAGDWPLAHGGAPRVRVVEETFAPAPMRGPVPRPRRTATPWAWKAIDSHPAAPFVRERPVRRQQSPNERTPVDGRAADGGASTNPSHNVAIRSRAPRPPNLRRGAVLPTSRHNARSAPGRAEQAHQSA